MRENKRNWRKSETMEQKVCYYCKKPITEWEFIRSNGPICGICRDNFYKAKDCLNYWGINLNQPAPDKIFSMQRKKELILHDQNNIILRQCEKIINCIPKNYRGNYSISIENIGYLKNRNEKTDLYHHMIKQIIDSNFDTQEIGRTVIWITDRAIIEYQKEILKSKEEKYKMKHLAEKEYIGKIKSQRETIP